MEPMSLLVWIFVGAIAGWLASKALKSDYWLIFDTIVGIAGAVVVGFLFNVFGRSGATGFNIWSIFVAFIGALLLLLLIRVMSGNRKFSRRFNMDSAGDELEKVN